MNIKQLTLIIITGFVIAITSCFIVLAATDAPHNESNNVNCGSCHGVGLLNSPFWGGTMSYDQLCLNCHKASSGPYSETNAPLIVTHSSETTSDKYSEWERECRNCHNPHYQRQKLYKNTDANNLYLATGSITNCVYNGDNTSTLTYSTITYKTGWDAAKLTEKTSGYRRTILFPNVNKLGYNYPITEIDTDAKTIKVTGNVTTYLYPPTTFAAIYGQYIKDAIDVSGTNKQVKFFDRKGAKSYADGDTTYNGVCEMCHTQTMYHKNDGTGNYHYPAARCYVCHNHINGFGYAHGEPGKDCEDCHGHDDGWNGGSYYGTTQSHSTHTENDSDDLKGPYITCSDCHDTNDYPFFKSGTDGDGDGKYNLSETDVCDNCHSPNGAFDGVNNPTYGAKANWYDGIYTSPTLKAGKEKWCAGCHDDQPAYSKGQHIEIIIDNLDPGASFTGTWGTSDWAPGYYGSNYHYHTTGAGTDKFTWIPVISAPGNYSVYARWTQGPTRAPDATYTIYHDGGNTPISVDQRLNGGTWVFLGTFSFDGVGDKVELVQSASGYVIADAIKWESGGQATYAPNVIGDNTTYGFYVTGHKINCLNCHDATRRHIDGEHRTYEVNESTGEVVNPYCDGYRLKQVDSKPCMNIPRPLYTSGTNPLTYWEDFALCFSCHNRYEVLSQTGVPGATNFWNDDSSPANSHNTHLGIYSEHFDSDWDLVADSSESCIACHNVHGSPTKAMIRHGELISTPDTTDKVPALNFAYLVPGPQYDPSATLEQSVGGRYNYTGQQLVYNGVCNACHGAISYLRTPNLSPRVINAKADPDTVQNNMISSSLITAFILDHDNNLSSVVVNLSLIGGSASQTMYDDGTHSDVNAGDGIYSYLATIPSGTSDSTKNLVITATDTDANTGQNTAILYVVEPGATYIDNTEGSYTGSWPASSSISGFYGENYQFHLAGSGTDTFTWTITISMPRTYEVFARWTQDPSRAPDATYTIYHDGGSTPVAVDQRSNGGQWVSLGTYDFDGTDNYIELVQNPNGYVIADAIKLKPVP
jgi:hypothetical protein